MCQFLTSAGVVAFLRRSRWVVFRAGRWYLYLHVWICLYDGWRQLQRKNRSDLSIDCGVVRLDWIGGLKVVWVWILTLVGVRSHTRGIARINISLKIIIVGTRIVRFRIINHILLVLLRLIMLTTGLLFLTNTSTHEPSVMKIGLIWFWLS